jgi:FKBP12-rapamycin complex-associated protein
MYPLLVACKSMSSSRRTAAQQVVDNVRHHSAALVKQVGHSTSHNHSLRT